MNAEMLYALRDAAGVPSHPLLFLLLGVVTFALHIGAVQVMLGSAALVLFNAFSADAMRRRLAAAMLSTAKIAVSVAVVLGVAPLLFVQVVYDPFWYTSNVLSAWRAIGFIVLLNLGYLALYVFYGRNPDLANARTPPHAAAGRWWRRWRCCCSWASSCMCSRSKCSAPRSGCSGTPRAG